ncbi:GNAT family N-acetyltransferase [Priestia taiwanensis]|uniref:N-acetyltransferase n=1 Tax=Priestia taiwanensis TaxID=1347902 RepID=A0A917ELR8_9BACI|nr:GNAT family N-acetyltransferase [Priestia taiwanensis]MBM7362288.1 N-acetylglutamate synthase-like GNAT family acetyltransferase [Priestia taiwanensis]GGE60982.1 N-acetyltransferase [Priestia taiwanensis]
MAIVWATNNDLEWINEQYKKVDFMPSYLENERIAIVTYKEEYAGLGRILYVNEDEAEIGGIYVLEAFRGISLAYELVDSLVQETKNSNLKEVYCLPFEELRSFYEKFGFKEVDYKHKTINNIIIKKYHWCLDHYDKKVLLLTL